MTSLDFAVLIPLIIIAAASIVIMLLIAIKRNHQVVNLISLIAFGFAFISLFKISHLVPVTISPLFIVDGYALFYIGLLVAAAFTVTLLSYSYLEQQNGNVEEFYILLFIATLGSSVLVISRHFISFFLGLEILSVSLYVLISYLRNFENALEAGIKYLILAAASSAFLLFGMALVYADLGTMDFTRIATKIMSASTTLPLSLAGFSMIIIGIGFKLAVVPFHMWTPDVYEGAPAPVTGFVATVSKGGMFALLLRFFSEIRITNYQSLMIVFGIIAVASMLIGNLLALKQNNVKRILAYSSIAHLGYLLVAFLAAGKMGIEAATFYLVAYFITTLGAFGIITVLSGKEREAGDIEDYRGLFWTKPVIASVFTIMLFSLAGIPLTAGFIGKYYLLASGVHASLWLLVIVLVASSVIGLYYYLRIITAMYSQKDEDTETSEETILISKKGYFLSSSIAIAALTFLLFWFGIFPAGIMTVIKSMIGS